MSGFLGIGSGTHPVSTFLSNTFGGVSQVLGTALGGATNVLNTGGGQIIAAQAGALFGNGTALSSAQIAAATQNTNSASSGTGSSARAKNPVTTGEGYDKPLTTNWFTEWHKIKQGPIPMATGQMVYDLDSSGYPQWNWGKILLSFFIAALVFLIVWAVRSSRKKGKSVGRRSYSSKARGSSRGRRRR